MSTSDPERNRERDSEATFGDYGGQYVPEALMPALQELEEAYERYVLENEDGFMDEFRERMRDFGGRPTPLQRADRLSERYDREIYLKREDLVHGGAHKLNNALGQVLLAKYMGKERIIAETGAGQHGTATAMAAAHLDMPCEIYMGRTDVNRQRPNVYRMRMNGAEVNPVEAGSGTLKEAINETMRDWATTVENTHYVIGSVVGPHPFPKLVRDFQAVIGREAREQIREKAGRLPDSVVACAGGGSNTMGTFHEFVPDCADPRFANESSGRSPRDDDVALYAVEAGGSSLEIDAEEGLAPNSATLSTGTDGVLHGAMTKLLQSEEGQIMESHSVSAGLDYAGVGPELSYLAETGRVTPVSVDDEAALNGFHRLSRLEGIIPALESSHALGYVEEAHDELGDLVVVNVSGRGDKDLETVLEETEKRDLEAAPEVEVFDRD
ncbi:tryptophan synthase, beta subunit [Haloterrigena turkmenica DSM 5511]|uniref:Tryptophan synthase beta chain n=1 Tax=Haloterrigena turkmenica (strain ATCC 51198 / DSM 5511 / JCM 9101 / NCIMB 13204 / VKM B-1734 / 4k) TaxID=543526 RepID=D2RXR6_HALTV|nr:tryptophan synthase subunit beta [Haloterrigena turkmenica]ADB59750.1 tryptophan synthase, beta subunit [Haloterrigena turkmenica DSM 5511]